MKRTNAASNDYQYIKRGRFNQNQSFNQKRSKYLIVILII
jgi:hypothetical protein